MRFAFLFPLILFLATTAQAQGTKPVEHLAVGVGAFNIMDSGGDVSALFSAEYRGNYLWEGLRPVAGISLDVDGGIYGYGGANYDLFLSDSWVLTPNFVVGGYHEGDSKDLGHALEFRSGLEVGYVMGDMSRLGMTFNHISNASLGDKNPGAESLMLIYSQPIYIFGD